MLVPHRYFHLWTKGDKEDKENSLGNNKVKKILSILRLVFQNFQNVVNKCKLFFGRFAFIWKGIPNGQNQKLPCPVNRKQRDWTITVSDRYTPEVCTATPTLGPFSATASKLDGHFDTFVLQVELVHWWENPNPCQNLEKKNNLKTSIARKKLPWHLELHFKPFVRHEPWEHPVRQL